MRIISLSVMLCISCHQNTVSVKQPVATAEATTKPARVGVILVCDISKSGFLNPDTATLTAFLHQYIYAGVVLTALHIKSDSRRQQPLLSPVMVADTIPITSSNFITADHTRKKNALLKQTGLKQCQDVVSEVARQFFVPLTHEHSDVQGGLQVASEVAKTYAGRNIRPVMIIVSDLLQDIKPGPEGLSPVSFPPNAEVIVIGPDPSVDLKKVFGPLHVQTLVSFQHLNL
jgi:hypothetical protein